MSRAGYFSELKESLVGVSNLLVSYLSELSRSWKWRGAELERGGMNSEYGICSMRTQSTPSIGVSRPLRSNGFFFVIFSCFL